MTIKSLNTTLDYNEGRIIINNERLIPKYPNSLVIDNLNKKDSKCSIKFNVLPRKQVSEYILVSKYVLKKRYIEAHFNRKYITEMINSPDHLIFLTSLVHLQKMIYLYLCYEFDLPISFSGKESLKVWPTKINVDMRNLITQSTDLIQNIKITNLKKTGPKSYFGKCISDINNGEATITADAVIYIL